MSGAAAAPPGRRRLGRGRRLVTGVLLLLAAVLLVLAGRLLVPGRRHAYDPGASPPASYRLTAGRTYQLSAGEPLASLRKSVELKSLACEATIGSAPPLPVTIVRTGDDDRDGRIFAAIRVPVSGRAHIRCDGIGKVFVDDADDVAFDYNGLAVLLATLLAVLGTGLVFGAGHEMDAAARRPA